MMLALGFAIQAFGLLPGLIKAGMDVTSFVTRTNASLEQMQKENRDPTDAEWASLNASVEELRAARPDVSDEA
jgi:hypothetical protein